MHFEDGSEEIVITLFPHSQKIKKKKAKNKKNHNNTEAQSRHIFRYYYNE